MDKKLAGVLFVYRGNDFDYCYLEAIRSLLEFTSHVFVVAGGDDNTVQDIESNIFNNGRLSIIPITQEHWDSKQGREKLSYFTNIGIMAAQEDGYEYQFCLQSDEIVHEKSYDFIWKAVNERGEGYLSTRINLWASPYLQLNVEHDRQPCNTNILRLTKTNYRSYGDAESIAAPFEIKYVNEIRIYHMGFVRERNKMKVKSIYMQKEVFLFENYDVKIDQSETFNPYLWFNKEDLVPIDEPLPKLIKDWAKERVYQD